MDGSVAVFTSKQIKHRIANKQTWEDPDVDVKKLGINKNDHVLAITSAGDNVLHYALAAQCERIHAVGGSLLVLAYSYS